jgi:hypothetical protein
LGGEGVEFLAAGVGEDEDPLVRAAVLYAHPKVMHPFGAALEARDIDAAIALLSDGVRLRSPVVFRPYQGRDAVAPILHATWSPPDGCSRPSPRAHEAALRNEDDLARRTAALQVGVRVGGAAEGIAGDQRFEYAVGGRADGA